MSARSPDLESILLSRIHFILWLFCKRPLEPPSLLSQRCHLIAWSSEGLSRTLAVFLISRFMPDLCVTLNKTAKLMLYRFPWYCNGPAGYFWFYSDIKTRMNGFNRPNSIQIYRACPECALDGVGHFTDATKTYAFTSLTLATYSYQYWLLSVIHLHAQAFYLRLYHWHQRCT